MVTRLIIIFLTIHFTLSIAQAQWFQQYPVTPFNNLLNVKFINKETGWTCGNIGTIIKTTNGGKNWIRQNCPVSKNLYKIFPVDSEVVYCVGFFECILKTTNGGDNWNIIRNSTQQSPSFEGLFFLNRDTGWLSKNQYILRTTDGCETFDSVLIKPSYIFDIYFRNYEDGLFCGEGANMYRTTNSGIDWTHIPIQPLADFNNLTFINSETGFTIGVQTNSVFKTTNFGLSWTNISTVDGADDSYSIFFPNLNTGWCAGTYGRMFKTNDGGYNWNEVNLSQFNTGYINSLWFYNDSIGWAVGAATKILHTENGGMTEIYETTTEIPNSFKLYQNYPNPFNPLTIIDYDLKLSCHITLKIYDALGNEVRTLVDKKQNPGVYSVEFNAENFSTGVYFYKLDSENFSEVKRMVIIK